MEHHKQSTSKSIFVGFSGSVILPDTTKHWQMADVCLLGKLSTNHTTFTNGCVQWVCVMGVWVCGLTPPLTIFKFINNTYM